MKHKYILIVGLLLLVLTSCISYTMVYDVVYDISLQAVERPVDAKTRYGEQIITQVQEEGVLKYCFEDEMVKILWLPTASSVNFLLANKTNHSIKIIWDEAVFIDEEGQNHRIIHSGVKYADRNNPQPPGIVARNTSIVDSVFPVDVKPIFPTQYITPEKVQFIEKKVITYIGKGYQVLLPLQIEDVINEYIFSFQVNDVKVQGHRL